MQLLDNLSIGNKLDLISKLALSVKTDIHEKKNSFYKAFGAWESKQTADEIIHEIGNSRNFTRQIDDIEQHNIIL
jgi:hypothetical protein